VNHALYVFERLKELSPFPGRSFFAGATRFVIPDVRVVKKDGEFVIILNEEEIPVLGISPFFMKVAGELPEGAGEKNPQHDDSEKKDVRDFARENIREARWFIKSINQRNLTLLKVSQAIVEFQRTFFTSGPKYLAPLTLRDIADAVSLHLATVSRTANSKYMQTEWGIFELRYFFSNSITGAGSKGSRFSKGGVKQIIKEVIESEQTNLSDQTIVDLLAKRGITLARRTVAKYRSELDFGSSFDR
jgi:RNA polymerase sigma-54 factor